jgi:glycosyltransferase involved in cell wall biosynthesis
VLIENLKISVLTATLNAADTVGGLISSLEEQTDQNFQWVIADGGSTDGTLEKVSNSAFSLRDVVVDSRVDTGFFSALNRAIRLADCDYYLVVGADDTLTADAIEKFRHSLLATKPDIFSADVISGSRRVSHRNPRWLWLYGPSAVVSCHSVGTIFRKDLHEELGFYDETYRIYGDSHFILKALRSGVSVERGDFVVGEFSLEGMSNNNHLVSFTEHFRAQVECGSSFFLQAALFIMRVVKWRARIVGSWNTHPASSQNPARFAAAQEDVP